MSLELIIRPEAEVDIVDAFDLALKIFFQMDFITMLLKIQLFVMNAIID